jgi:hypothetical protein
MFLTVERLIARLTAEARRASPRPTTVRHVVDPGRTLEAPLRVAPDASARETNHLPKE